MGLKQAYAACPQILRAFFGLAIICSYSSFIDWKHYVDSASTTPLSLRSLLRTFFFKSPTY
ncbi:hypothetical protein VAE151_550547 [Vibrio aestuarianus]|nr:hypothetical protein VAE151_550547 [Vibrio aestuarianus]